MKKEIIEELRRNIPRSQSRNPIFADFPTIIPLGIVSLLLNFNCFLEFSMVVVTNYSEVLESSIYMCCFVFSKCFIRDEE